MEQFDSYKRAYYGYFISFIRVDIYNKIILKAVLEDKSNLSYNQINLENSLKNELQNKSKMHYFNKYFNYRKEFYDKFYDDYNYDVYETIDLIYEYRNFLLDDIDRINMEKFPITKDKTLKEKEEDIKSIIALLLSEKTLEKYSTYIQNILEQQNLLDYQSYFFSQEEEVIEYRKYLNRYFGYTAYNNKIAFLQRYLVGQEVSLAKKYQLLIHQYIQLQTLTQEEISFFTDLDVKITFDYLDANFGLLEIQTPLLKTGAILISFNQLLIFYLLKKQGNEFSVDEFINFLSKKETKTSYNNKTILLSKDIYEYNLSYFSKIEQNKKVLKYIKGHKEIDSIYLLKLLSVKRALNRNVKNIAKYINSRDFEKNLLAVEIITGYFDKRNIKKSVEKYLNLQYQNIQSKQDEIFSIFNQMKFTTNINNLKQMKGFKTEYLNALQKDYKEKKDNIAEKYIETIYILLKLRVHKYNKEKDFLNAYIYRNNVMHFEKEVNYTKFTKRVILKELNKINKIEEAIKEDIVFDDVFFNLLKRKYNKKIK